MKPFFKKLIFDITHCRCDRVTYLIVTWVFVRALCLFFCSDEAVGRHRLSILLARFMDWSAFLRFCTLVAFLSGEVLNEGMLRGSGIVSPLRSGTDFTNCVLRGSMSAKLTCDNQHSADYILSQYTKKNCWQRMVVWQHCTLPLRWCDEVLCELASSKSA